MTPVVALAEIRRLATAGRVRLYDVHVRQSMAKRNIRANDVFSALRNAGSCMVSTNGPGRWKVTGPDLDGDALDVVVVIEGDLVVITVF